MKNSLSHREVSYVYQHATVFPVKLDFQGLQFGYILKIPNPKESDVYPLYRLYNIGFFRSPPISKHFKVKRNIPDYMVYRAPFPEYAVLTRSGGLKPLDTTMCATSPGILHCEIGSIAREKSASPCLDLLTTENCKNCEAWKKCSKEIALMAQEGQGPKVVTTPAGALVRSLIEPVRIYKKFPHLSPGDSGILQTPNHYGTYWLPHSEYAVFSVGTAVYATQGQSVHVTRVMQPEPFYFTSLPTEQNLESMEEIQSMKLQHDELDQVLENFDKLNIHENDHIWRTPALRYSLSGMSILSILLSALIILTFLYCCCCRRSKTGKTRFSDLVHRKYDFLRYDKDEFYKYLCKMTTEMQNKPTEEDTRIEIDEVENLPTRQTRRVPQTPHSRVNRSRNINSTTFTKTPRTIKFTK